MKNKKLVLFDFIAFVIKDVERTDFWGICAQMSFYLLMAFFPLIIFLINFIGRFILKFKEYLFDVLKTFLPNLSYNYVVNLINILIQDLDNNNYVLLAITFFFATLAARAIMTGMNQNYGNIENRSPLKILLLSFLFTFLFAIVLILIIITYLFSEAISLQVLNNFGIDHVTLNIMNIFTFIFTLIISAFLFNCIYILAPNKRLPFKQGFPGAIFATIGLNIVFRIFLIFINNSPKYTILYGNLGGLFALLVGIYFICVILNLGGKINVYFFI
ncbi:MAG: YihY/virulence factor BrkB family protein [Eubacterium sp.]